MKDIEFKVTYADGKDEIVRVGATRIGTGFKKVIRVLQVRGTTMRTDHAGDGIHSIEFWRIP